MGRECGLPRKSQPLLFLPQDILCTTQPPCTQPSGMVHALPSCAEAAEADTRERGDGHETGALGALSQELLGQARDQCKNPPNRDHGCRRGNRSCNIPLPSQAAVISEPRYHKLQGFSASRMPQSITLYIDHLCSGRKHQGRRFRQGLRVLRELDANIS